MPAPLGEGLPCSNCKELCGCSIFLSNSSTSLYISTCFLFVFRFKLLSLVIHAYFDLYPALNHNALFFIFFTSAAAPNVVHPFAGKSTTLKTMNFCRLHEMKARFEAQTCLFERKLLITFQSRSSTTVYTLQLLARRVKTHVQVQFHSHSLYTINRYIKIECNDTAS